MPFDTGDQVIENFKLMYEKIKPFVDQQFDLQPKTPFEIRRVEAFREKSAAAHYNRGSLDGSRPGIFYVPIPNVQKYNVFDNEALFLHEAIPGHHFQISIQQENQKLPNFRKNSFYSAFSEGWALYTNLWAENWDCMMTHINILVCSIWKCIEQYDWLWIQVFIPKAGQEKMQLLTLWKMKGTLKKSLLLKSNVIWPIQVKHFHIKLDNLRFENYVT